MGSGEARIWGSIPSGSVFAGEEERNSYRAEGLGNDPELFGVAHRVAAHKPKLCLKAPFVFGLVFRRRRVPGVTDRTMRISVPRGGGDSVRGAKRELRHRELGGIRYF